MLQIKQESCQLCSDSLRGIGSREILPQWLADQYAK